jgi:TonB family protein
MNSALDLKRVFAALVVSCLMHAALALALFLGGSKGASNPAVQGGQKLKPPRALSVTLLSEKGASAPVVAASVKEASPAVDRTAVIGLIPIPVPMYYATSQLSKRPQPTTEVELDAPEIRSMLAAGTIILKLWINEHGEVISVEVEKSEVPELVSGSAVAAFRLLRFEPGELNGRRVGSVMKIEITYDDGRLASP